MKTAAVSGFCIAAAILCRIFDKNEKEYGVMISAMSAVIIAGICAAMLSPLIDFILDCFEKTGAGEKYINILFKSAGVCFLTSLSSGICRDSGENTLSQSVDTVGRITLAIISLPLLEDISEIAERLIK